MRLLRIGLICTALVFCAEGCMRKLSRERHVQKYSIRELRRQDSMANSTPMITVFIHGTRIFPKFYLQELFYSPDGLHRVTDLEPANHMHAIAHELVKAAPQRFSYGLFYAFGWNGKLDFDERKKEARRLYHELSVLRKSYEQQYGSTPRIRIITHSHGGNVALNLVTARDPQDSSFAIDELVLLGCPVQDETKNFALHSLFGRVYAISSSYDLLQIIDPQGLYKCQKNAPSFSERYFPQGPNIYQGRIKMYGRSLFHIEYLSKKFFAKLPAIIDTLTDCCTRGKFSMVPLIHVGHTKIKVVST